MPSKTRYLTGLSITMLVLSSCLAIPTIIEGINIVKNMQEYYNYNEIITADHFIHFSFHVRDSSGINIDLRSEEYNGTHSLDLHPVILSLMREEEFDAWVLEGSLEPEILNSTYYYYQSDFEISNLNVGFYDELYFVLYNSANVSMNIDINVDIIPWGHIIPTSITGFLFSLFFLIFIIKIISAAVYNGIIDIKGRNRPSGRPQGIHQDSIVQNRNGVYCPSCGAELTPKDTNYCPNCGSSV